MKVAVLHELNQPAVVEDIEMEDPKAIWIGAPPLEPLSLDAGLVFWGEKTVMGSNYGSARPRFDMPRLLSLYRAGKLKLDELVTRTYQLEEVNEAFTDMLNGEVARGIIRF
jgi:S-(hydroxymethyl)glutathione dehydrogenase/alcohol dehydrogenase